MKNYFGNPNENLVKLNQDEFDVLFDIKYATTDNFTGKVIYKNSDVYIHRDLFDRLKLASKRAISLGYKIKIFDAWRPYEAQEVLWSLVPDPRYVSNPKTGFCGHCRGISLDVTLVDLKNLQDIDMGTDFDSFDEKSHHSSNDLTIEQLRNRILLAGIINSVGMSSFETEWWHYDYKNSSKEYQKYKLSDFKTNQQ
jgi:D-alanyl-D-alanine dipeptidase